MSILLDTLNQVGAVLGYVGVSGGTYLTTKVRALADAIVKTEAFAKRAEEAKVAAEAAKTAAELAAKKGTSADVSRSDIERMVANSVADAMKRTRTSAVDSHDVEDQVQRFYEHTVKRALKIEWKSWLDETKDKLVSELERKIDDKLDAELESHVKRALRHSKPDDVDPFVQQQLDNIDRRLGLLEKQFVEAAGERSESWRAFYGLVNEMRSVMDEMRSALRASRPPRG